MTGFMARLLAQDYQAGDWNWRRLSRKAEAAVLTERCKLAEKGCNLAEIFFIGSSPRQPQSQVLKMFQFEGFTPCAARRALRGGDQAGQRVPNSLGVLRHPVGDADRL